LLLFSVLGGDGAGGAWAGITGAALSIMADLTTRVDRNSLIAGGITGDTPGSVVPVRIEDIWGQEMHIAGFKRRGTTTGCAPVRSLASGTAAA
jgi:hypothetical protein